LNKKPRIVCRYREGSFGHIYYARRKDGRIFIIKQFKTNFDGELCDVNLNEINMNFEIKCSAVASFLAFGHCESMIYGVMQHHGKNVSELLALNYFRYDPAHSPEEIFRDFAEQLYGAIAALHAEGFTHNDISADNVLLNRRTKKIKLIDCGFAKKTKADAAEHANALVRGTHADIKAGAAVIKLIFNHSQYNYIGWYHDLIAAGDVNTDALLAIIRRG
jgi:serine/threonine protein kinase